MSNTVWVVTDVGFEKAEIIDAGPNSRHVKMLEGKREGKVLFMPPVGAPNGEFHPALYEGAEPPNLWRFNRRSLRVRDSKDFAEQQQAEALIPQEEPYTFLPHTLHLVDGILASDHQLLFGPTGVGKTSLVRCRVPGATAGRSCRGRSSRRPTRRCRGIKHFSVLFV